MAQKKIKNLRIDGKLKVGGTELDPNVLAEINTLNGLTASVAELNIMDGVTKTAAQINLLVAGVAGGYKVARGVASITGSGTVVTGLATVVAVVATAADDPDGTTLAAVSASIGNQSGAPAAGSVYLKAWKITAADNGALIAADAAKNINWVAIGT